jgi:hypothetical protein
MAGIRVVADPRALDEAQWSDGAIVLRIAPDEALAVGATAVTVADDHAIVAGERGFSGWWLQGDEVGRIVARHAEWELPRERPATAQGLLAGVPVKVWLGAGAALLLCPSAWAHELDERIR